MSTPDQSTPANPQLNHEILTYLTRLLDFAHHSTYPIGEDHALDRYAQGSIAYDPHHISRRIPGRWALTQDHFVDTKDTDLANRVDTMRERVWTLVKQSVKVVRQENMEMGDKELVGKIDALLAQCRHSSPLLG